MTENILDTIENTLLDYHVSMDAMRWTPPEKHEPEAPQVTAPAIRGDVYVGTPDGGMVPLGRFEGLVLSAGDRAPRLDEDPSVALGCLCHGVVTEEQYGDTMAAVFGEIFALAGAIFEEHRQRRHRISAMRSDYHRRRKARARRKR